MTKKKLVTQVLDMLLNPLNQRTSIIVLNKNHAELKLVQNEIIHILERIHTPMQYVNGRILLEGFDVFFTTSKVSPEDGKLLNEYNTQGFYKQLRSLFKKESLFLLAEMTA